MSNKNTSSSAGTETCLLNSTVSRLKLAWLFVNFDLQVRRN